jgi:hypothetical protein
MFIQKRNFRINYFDITACRSAPCKNGASCFTVGTNDYVCGCAPQYTGRQCETVLCKLSSLIKNKYFLLYIKASCSSVLCSNGGTCVSMTGGTTYRCACAPGYTGDQCTSLITSMLFFKMEYLILKYFF